MEATPALSVESLLLLSVQAGKAGVTGGATKDTVILGTPFPLASLTTTCKGAAKAVPTVALWPDPLSIAREAGTPALMDRPLKLAMLKHSFSPEVKQAKASMLIPLCRGKADGFQVPLQLPGLRVRMVVRAGAAVEELLKVA